MFNKLAGFELVVFTRSKVYDIVYLQYVTNYLLDQHLPNSILHYHTSGPVMNLREILIRSGYR